VIVTAPDASKCRSRSCAWLSHHERHEKERAHTDGDVDEEDPLPAHVLGEHAAEKHADGGSRAGDGAEDAERLVALRALLEGDGGDREDGRREHRPGSASRPSREKSRSFSMEGSATFTIDTSSTTIR
jgi:hypothetical protein